MKARDIWAVIPVKETQFAKRRLAGALPAAGRGGLALAMLEDVLAAVTEVRRLAGVVVVTADPTAAAIAQRYDALVISDIARRGYTEAVTATAQRLSAEGRGGMLQIPADIPLVTAQEISSLLAEDQQSPSFTIVPARDNLGSNAILVSPPDAVPLRFGHDSFFSHLAAARQHGIEPSIVRLPGICLDIDLPKDLRAFTGVGSRTHTQEFLVRCGYFKSPGGIDRAIVAF